MDSEHKDAIHGSKRPLSSVSDSTSLPDTKRSRNSISESGRTSTTASSGTANVAEKQRSKRLFGGILGTLSQRPSSSTLQERKEFEKRQEDKRKQSQEAAKKAQLEKSQKLRDRRLASQIVWEKECMDTRHAHMLLMANFLITKSQPPLYYKPWRLLPEQEAIINTQIADITQKIQQEVSDFAQKHNPPPSRDTVTEKETTMANDRGSGNASKKPITDTDDTGRATAVDATSESGKDVEEKDIGEEVITEHDEDSVIY